ncbi:NACHT domain-containing protein, partial [Colwellia psychrerythraea]
MRQTLEFIAETIVERSIPIKNLLVLSETSKRDTLVSLLQKYSPAEYSSIEAKEITYSDYIWKDCLADEFKKIEPQGETDCYIPQQIESNQVIYDSAVSFLTNELKENSDFICHLLIGGGGIGKSSLCCALVTALEKEGNTIPFLISSEEIRNYTEDNNYNPDFIHGPYELYEIQSKCNDYKSTMERKLFNLALLSGNITIIIDGLDEFPSIFGGKFDTKVFLDSVSEIHSELGKSKIIITSRDQKFLENNEILNLNFNKFELLGFTEQTCKKYLRRRFAEHEDRIEISNEIFKKFQKSSLAKTDRIVPFFAEVLCNIYDDIKSVEEVKTKLIDSNLPYECLNTLTDKIIYSVFIREEIRHIYPISALEMFEIFCTFTAKYGKNWELTNLKSDLKMSYD